MEMRSESGTLFNMELGKGRTRIEEAGSLDKHYERPFGVVLNHGEFDPGSERTLAARFKHASRGVGFLRRPETGERVSNT